MVIVFTNLYMSSMSSALAALRTAWLSMLVLLLGLMPFIHGHLGQPVQSGWHIHALSALEEVQASAQFDGLACLASHHRHTMWPGSALHAPEPSDIEPATGIAQSRLSQLRPAAVAAASPTLPTPLAAAFPRAGDVPSSISWPGASRQILPGLRHGLPPPAQAPPSRLV